MKPLIKLSSIAILCLQASTALSSPIGTAYGKIKNTTLFNIPGEVTSVAFEVTSKMDTTDQIPDCTTPHRVSPTETQYLVNVHIEDIDSTMGKAMYAAVLSAQANNQTVYAILEGTTFKQPYSDMVGDACKATIIQILPEE